MLLSFRFANHRSFRDEQQLNLTPVYGSDAGDPSVVEAVPVAGVFGANASGKSNLLDALSFLRDLAVDSDRRVEPGLGLPRRPFRLEPEFVTSPSRYVVDLLLNGIRHTYGCTIDNERVVEEWLYHYPLKKKRRIFERDGDQFAWGEQSGRHGDLEKIAEITAPTALYLSTAARFTHRTPAPTATTSDPLQQVYLWFRGLRSRRRPSVLYFGAMAHAWPDGTPEQRHLVALLQAADLGILDVRVEQYHREVLAIADEEAYALDRTASRQIGEVEGRRLKFTHRGANGETILDLADESTGTQQLLDLSIVAMDTLRDGGLMTVDEIDASLHPMLTAKLIGLFQSSTTNPRRSQLLFTSHDVTLLGTFDSEEVLLRDQIWFTEKNNDGASVLYPLTDFRPRRAGENRPRRYLNGNYGGVPDLSTDLFEQALVGRGELDAQATH
ncbi:ATP-binding protein [Solwaraspora sp. WMMD406]|uniref:AAA family ATPase n=1 Tax=Solwaraspora sp. WMMD406 TaxID=3016095 RepID=UPI0024170D0F|nr:ATP-binding protein [Solwaraspora sp. WMMD406]MDG4764145.1 ATP-binding protein [Solwaraspora sp. WMMD406]